MKRIYFWLVIFISIVIVILTPLVIDWLIGANDIHSNISNSAWVSFLGGYSGSIVAALVSVLGIVVTIRLTKAQLEMTKFQFEEQKRLNNIPILDCEILSVFEAEDSPKEAISMDVEYSLDKTKKFKSLMAEFEIFNVGLGAVLDLKYGMSVDGVFQDGVFWIPGRDLLRNQTSINQKIRFYIPEREEFSFSLLIYYEDIIGNKYCKTIELVTRYNKHLNELSFFLLKQDRGVLYENKQNEKLYYVIPSLNAKK